jgi:putative peptidoglycan lipid II flippase
MESALTISFLQLFYNAAAKTDMRDLTSDSLNIGKAGTIIFSALFIDKLLGITKEILVAHRFGVSSALDVFNVAMASTGLIIVFLTSAFVSAFVPIYTGWINQYSLKKANEKSLSILYGNITILSLLTLIAYFLVPHVFPLIGYGFGPEQTELGIRIQRWLIILFIIEGFGITFFGILQAKKLFFCYATAPIFISLTVVIFLSINTSLGIYVLVYGLLLGTFLKVCYIFIYLKQSDFRFITAKIDLPAIKTYYLLALPMIGSEVIAVSNFLVDQVMATSLIQGAVSSLNYAHRISSLPIYIVVVAIAQAILPYVSQYAAEGNLESFRNTYKNSIIFAGFISFFPMIFLLWFSHDIVSIMLERGAFDRNATNLTGGNLFYYSFGIFFHAYVLIHGAYFVALKNTRALILLASVSFVLNILFNYILMQYMGVHGIAFSTSITLFSVFLVSFFILKKMIDFRESMRLFNNIFIMIACSITVYFIGFFLLRYTFLANLGNYIYLPLFLTVFTPLYFFMLWIFRTREIESCFYIFLQLGLVVLKKIKLIKN